MSKIRHNCYNCEHLKLVYDVNAIFGGHIKLCKAKGKKLHILKRGMLCKSFESCNMTYPEKLWKLDCDLNRKE